MDKIWSLWGAVFAFLGVALGAFGAHALKTKLSTDLLAVFEVGVRYQMYHALGLFAVAWALTTYSHPALFWAGISFVLGILLFSGSLYILSLTGVKSWGAITPIGGLFFLIGWALLFWGIARS